MILTINSDLAKQNKSSSKTLLANDLGVSRQLLYYQPKLPKKDLLLCEEIKKVMAEHKSYGYRRIALELKINHKRVLRVMKLFNLKIKRSPKMPLKLKDKGFVESKTAVNLISKLEINHPNQVWSADFTYLKYRGKFYYFATVIDSFTREIIGNAISARHNTALVLEALFNAIKKRQNIAPEIFHSDQGSEYRSEAFTKVLTTKSIKISFSKKASPWQNGRQESLYGKFKLELGDPNIYQNLGELVEALALQVCYYNNERIHSALKCPPRVFYENYNRCITDLGPNKPPKKHQIFGVCFSFFGSHFWRFKRKKIKK